MTSKNLGLLRIVEEVIQDQYLSEEEKSEKLREVLEMSPEFKRKFSLLKKAANDEMFRDALNSNVSSPDVAGDGGKLQNVASEVRCRRLSEKFPFLVDNKTDLEGISSASLPPNFNPSAESENEHQAASLSNNSRYNSNGNNKSIGVVPNSSGGIEDMLPKHRIPVLSPEPTVERETEPKSLHTNLHTQSTTGERRSSDLKTKNKSDKGTRGDKTKNAVAAQPLGKVNRSSATTQVGKGVFLHEKVVLTPTPHIFLYMEMTKCLNVVYKFDISSSSNLKWRKEEYPNQSDSSSYSSVDSVS
jgi:hypothetical protein